MDISEHHDQLAAEGYTIVHDAFDAEVCNALLTSVRNLERGHGPSNNRFEGARTTRTYNLLALDPVWQQVPVHPIVCELVEANLGAGFLISSLASISLAPGETAQVIHADDQVHGLAKPHRPTVCNSMWALTDFTEANGATRLVPGSHRWDNPDYFSPSEIESIPAEMPAGSIMVWTGSLWHGGGANTTTNDVRVGVAMNYCAGFIRQQENIQLGTPSEVMSTFSPQLRQLCGLGMYRGLTGNINKRSPAELLYGDPPQVGLWDSEPI